VALPVRWRYKLDRWRKEIAAKMHSEPKVARPKLCPACGTLLGASATQCHQCGASATFGLSAASRSLARFVPQTSPVTYGILALCCVLYGVSFLATVNRNGLGSQGGGGLGAIFNLGSVSSPILARMGMSAPFDLVQPWRLVTAIFLHGGLLHIGFNMWVLMDLGPTLEEMYGSARFFFIFVATGVAGYVLSSLTGHYSVGASGSLLGMIGVLLALTMGRQSIGMRMLRSQLIYWLIYIAVMGFIFREIDNFAHIGGFVAGFALGKVMIDRKPADVTERKRADALGWAAGIAVIVSFAFMLLNYFSTPFGG
jgi:membrane associated rhomboid family serine protease